MIRRFCILLFTVVITSANAQQGELTLGLNAPIGNWARTNNFRQAGYAAPGWMVEFAAGGAESGDKFGFKFYTDFGINRFKKNKFEQQFRDSALVASGTQITDFKIGKYFHMGLGIGPEFRFGISDNIDFTAHALGMLEIFMPPLTMKAFYTDAYGEATYDFIGGDFAWLEVFGVSYKIGAGIILNDKFVFRLDFYKMWIGQKDGLAYGGLGVNARYPQQPSALQFKFGIRI